jgi:hypothetical protein
MAEERSIRLQGARRQRTSLATDVSREEDSPIPHSLCEHIE